MAFLVAKILGLLALAAVCGAALAWGWFRRRYTDITGEYTRWQEELSQWRRGFEERLAARPEVDLAPLARQLEALEDAVRAIHIPEPKPPDLTPVLDAIGGIRVPEPADLEPVQLRLDNLESHVGNLREPAAALDLTPLLQRLEELRRMLGPRLIVLPQEDAGVEPAPKVAAEPEQPDEALPAEH